jgi:ribosome-associated toxin RatA of RatAB toxin-antitoxin module
MNNRLLTLLCVLLLLPVGAGYPALADDKPCRITFTEKEGRFLARAKGVIHASRDRVWFIINEYGNHDAYMPGSLESRVLSREGNRLLVYKKIRVGLRKMEYVLRVTQFPAEGLVRYRLHEGPFQRNRGYWKMKDLGDGRTELIYEMDLEPDFDTPGFLQKIVYRQTLPDFYRAVRKRAAELDRE